MRTFLSSLMLLALLGCAQPPAASGPVLLCRLEAAGPTSIRFALVNQSQEVLRVLRWNTPLEDWTGTIFTVTKDGAELPYQGPMVKRGDPMAEDYIEIQPSAMAAAVADLSQSYDLSAPGRYQVKVTEGLGLFDVAPAGAAAPRPRDQHQPMALDCPAVTLEVTAPGPAL